jgi:hypothetical protein
MLLFKQNGDGVCPVGMTAQQMRVIVQAMIFPIIENSWKIRARDSEEKVIGCSSETRLFVVEKRDSSGHGPSKHNITSPTQKSTR